MLNHIDDSSDSASGGDRAELGLLLTRLIAELRGWAGAEAELAAIELQALKVMAVKAVILALVAFSAMICALLALSQWAIAMLAPLAAAAAPLLVAVGFLLLAAACVVGLRSAMRWRAESVFFRWAGSRRLKDGAP